MNMLKGNALQTNNSSKIVISVKDHEIGDIVWAKLGKFPFWPSIVCLDPKSKIFIKSKYFICIKYNSCDIKIYKKIMI